MRLSFSKEGFSPYGLAGYGVGGLEGQPTGAPSVT